MADKSNGDGSYRDLRTNLMVLRQFEKVEQIKRRMIKAGLLRPDATPAEVVEAMRAAVPPDLFGQATLAH